MQCEDKVETEHSLAKVHKVCRLIGIIVKIIFVVFCVCWLSTVLLMIYSLSANYRSIRCVCILFCVPVWRPFARTFGRYDIGAYSMPIVLHLDEVMADRHISLNELADKVGITNVNLSRIKTGKVRAVRFSTLDMLCEVLKCQPGDILKHVSADEANAMFIDENAEL